MVLKLLLVEGYTHIASLVAVRRECIPKSFQYLNHKEL